MKPIRVPDFIIDSNVRVSLEELKEQQSILKDRVKKLEPCVVFDDERESYD